MSAQRHAMKALIVPPLVVSLLALSACNHNSATSDTSAASAPQAASTPVAYTPPTADQLYQMVAPIALFPDKLVALVLAGSTYPDQITAANTWVAQNPSLTGQALANAADTQPWDPSVKALTKFPAVLAQMASNIAWTTALGQAYYNDPTDVLNAIQVMRQRAQASGSLHSSSQMRITQVAQGTPSDYTPANDAPVIYSGPDIVPPPAETIEIDPAQPDEVYVPTYDPGVVYGEPVSAYPGYVYQPPVYSTGAAVPAGVIGFGVAIAVGAAIIGHHDWGWHSWGMNWGAPHRDGGPDYRQRPAVVYNHTTYVSRSNTVINNITNIRNTEINNNYSRNVTNNTTYVRNPPPQEPGRAPGMQPHPGGAPMSMPHFGANDERPGSRPPPEAFGQNHPGAPGQPPGAMHDEQRQQMQQQQQRQEMQQQDEARQQQQHQQMQQQDEARQQQQRQEAQQQDEARQQQQRQQMQQQDEARQQQQRQEAQQQDEARQQQQRQQTQQQDEARQQQQRQEAQQQDEARQQQQRQQMQQQEEARQQQQHQQMQQQQEARQQQQHNEAQRPQQHAPQDQRDHHPQ